MAKKSRKQNLTREREVELVRKYQRTGDEDAFNELYHSLYDYIRSLCALRARESRHDIDELFSAVLPELLSALRTYNTKSEARLTTFLYPVVHRAISKEIAVLNNHTGVPTELSPIIAIPEAMDTRGAKEEEERKYIWEVVMQIIEEDGGNEENCTIFKMYVSGMNYTKISEAVGRKRTAKEVSDIVNRARDLIVDGFQKRKINLFDYFTSREIDNVMSSTDFNPRLVL